MAIAHHNPTPAAPKRVVVIGASGFVGQDLIRYLSEQNIPTVPLSSRELDLLQPEVSEKLKQIVREDDAIALISALTPDKGRDIRTLMQNLTMVENASKFLEQIPCSHLVYISSDAVYEDEANPVRETSCCNPSSFHGLMHLAREKMLAYAAQKAKTPLLILRPCAIYGAADTHNSYGPNRFRRTALKDGKITLFGRGEEQRDHLYIKDLSRIVSLGLMHRSEGTLNVSPGNAIAFWDVARLTVELCPNEVEIECLPRSNPITHRHFDITETLEAFPEFSYTPFEVGLTESFK